MSDRSPSLPPIGFGLGRLHHVFSRKERERILLSAFDSGLSHFDLAAAYGNGLCEAEAGRILRPHRSLISLATKFGIPSQPVGEGPAWIYFARKGFQKAFSRSYGSEYALRDFSGAAAMNGIEDSLRRLRTDYLDYLFYHEPRHAEDCDAVCRAVEVLERLKEQGKILNYGVSAHTDYFRARGSTALVGDIVQFELAEDSPTLVQRVPKGLRTSAFGLIRFFGRDRHGTGRLDYADVLGRFFRDFPSTMPILASNRPAEILRMGRAVQELGRPHLLRTSTG